MTDKNPDLTLQTRVVHPDDWLAPGFESLCVPVTRASTVVFRNLAMMRAPDSHEDAQWRYGLHATPTSVTLAQRVAALEGGNHALLYPSGLSAIATVYFAFLRSGDDVLVADNIYGPSREHAKWMANRYGVSVRFFDPLVDTDIDRLIGTQTRLIWLESPGSVTDGSL